MQTQLLHPNTDPAAIDTAAALLRAGEVVAMPTETVYGLAANALDAAACRKIFAAKGRPQDNPLIVHIAEVGQLDALCSSVPDSARRLAAAFWPGPLTLVLPKSDLIPAEVSAGLNTVGIRLPAHPIARALIEKSGLPLAAPSANTSGKPSPTTAAHVLDDLGGKIPAIVEGGACTVGVESTVVSLCGKTPRLLRPGGVTAEQLREILGEIELDRAIFAKIDENERVSAPGMKYRHYAPRAPLTVVQGAPEQTAAYIKAQAAAGDGVLCFSEYAADFANQVVREMGSQSDSAAQARRVFACLRAFDATEVGRIWAQCPTSEGLGLAVSNRIGKAGGFSMIRLQG